MSSTKLIKLNLSHLFMCSIFVFLYQIYQQSLVTYCLWSEKAEYSAVSQASTKYERTNDIAIVTLLSSVECKDFLGLIKMSSCSSPYQTKGAKYYFSILKFLLNLTVTYCFHNRVQVLFIISTFHITNIYLCINKNCMLKKMVGWASDNTPHLKTMASALSVLKK